MDIQEKITRQIHAIRAAEFAASDQLSLGQIIDLCEAIPLREGEDEQRVRFDFEYARPTGFDSWRGIYAELALNFSFDGKILLSEFITMAKEAVGATFVGYKGGDFTMTRDTPVWVANYGNSGETAVKGVLDNGYEVFLLTGFQKV